ncbi:MAG: hypothetical protein M1818_001971 [Claussenomyces sp. TS43310]|nr:MAG: hypothetical protein M1818_001971 [Claussenomyces sp. TS43310]
MNRNTGLKRTRTQKVRSGEAVTKSTLRRTVTFAKPERVILRGAQVQAHTSEASEVVSGTAGDNTATVSNTSNIAEPTALQSAAKEALTMALEHPRIKLTKKELSEPGLGEKHLKDLRETIEKISTAIGTGPKEQEKPERKDTKTQEPDRAAQTLKRLDFGLTYMKDADATDGAARPRAIAYGRHPTRGRDDTFYEHKVTQLYRQIETVAEVYFGLPTPDGYEIDRQDNNPWLQDLPVEFMNYAELVAEPDWHSGGWTRLMCDVSQRKFLIIGILARILESKVFSELLFGADEYQTAMLETMEKTLVLQDGYERTALRAHTVRTLLGNYAVPQEFDSTVTRLTAQVIYLLRPLVLSLAKVHNEYPREEDYPPLLSLYQALNDIVSKAGYLSLCMRLESSIFYLQSENPGSRFDEDDHQCLDTHYYQCSKENVARAQVRSQGPPGQEVHPRTYRALTKIAVWPSIKRFKPGNGLAGGKKNGFRIFDVCKAGVVSYWGSTDPKARAHMGLKEWCAEQKGIAQQTFPSSDDVAPGGLGGAVV